MAAKTDRERNRTIQSASLIVMVRNAPPKEAVGPGTECCLLFTKNPIFLLHNRAILNVTTPGNVYLITAAHFLDTVFLVLNALCDCVC